MLWVKGSGGDIGSMKLDGFATLYLDKLHALKALYRGLAHEDAMVDYFPHCTFNLNPRATSIDTPLHCFIPHRHIDHMHADAIIAIAAARNGERLTRDDFRRRDRLARLAAPRFRLAEGGSGWSAASGDERPGARQPRARSHGAATSQACYETTLRIIQQAADWLDRARQGRAVRPDVTPPLPERRAPRLRHRAARRAARHAERLVASKVMHLPTIPSRARVRRLSARAEELAARGTTCPDHFLRTKVRPLFVPFDPRRESPADLIAAARGRWSSSIATSTRRTTNDASGATRRRCAIRIRC